MVEYGIGSTMGGDDSYQSISLAVVDRLVSVEAKEGGYIQYAPYRRHTVVVEHLLNQNDSILSAGNHTVGLIVLDACWNSFTFAACPNLHLSMMLFKGLYYGSLLSSLISSLIVQDSYTMSHPGSPYR